MCAECVMLLSQRRQSCRFTCKPHDTDPVIRLSALAAGPAAGPAHICGASARAASKLAGNSTAFIFQSTTFTMTKFSGCLFALAFELCDYLLSNPQVTACRQIQSTRSHAKMAFRTATCSKRTSSIRGSKSRMAVCSHRSC